ncbi:MAG: PqqD family protein [Chloracidobacterium sp.]|uniref:PqqD family protein n=1 Tax=Chloracidobacterium validum TaxID=2821543 RepID=A0ABX8BAF9_9BACT|nr:PqqD family protein [Chloracidobacterium validum]QUW02654.1 PqqD family protein [Chloracidobacterium validum]
MTTFRPHPSVVSTEVEDAIVLLHLDTKRYFTLNSTGAAIWKHLSQGKPETDIVAALAAEYDADETHLAASTRRMLEQLEKAALIEPDQANSA